MSGTAILAYEATNDRVSSVTDPVTGAVSYIYLLNGARSTMSLPGGGTWTYAYTGANSYGNLPKDDPNSVVPMLNTITDDQGRVCEYRTDLSGQLHECFTNRSYDALNALVGYCYTQYLYDKTGVNSNGWLTRIQNVWYTKVGSQWTSRTLTQNDYAYNNAGMRTANQISDQNGVVRTESYGYDELYRLTSVNYGDGQTQSYSFDAMGNRTQKVDSASGTEAYSYNAANMLLTRGANQYTNDLNGNTLTGGGRTSVWDSQNRLAQCAYNGTTSVFTYAADGIRHRSAVGANTTDYILDGPMFVREKLNGSVSATYLVGPRGPEYRRDHSTGTIRWYCYDGLGSVLGECDSSGNLTRTQSYDVYGAVRTSAGTSTSKHKYVGSLGHPSEDETGLVYMRARYMDPVTGRFASEDPSRQGANWFVYCADNPIACVDSNGRWMSDSTWQFLECLLCYLNVAVDAGVLKGFLNSASRDTIASFLRTMADQLLARADGETWAAREAYGSAKIGAVIDDVIGKMWEAREMTEFRNRLTNSLMCRWGAWGLKLLAEIVESGGYGDPW